MTGPRLWRWLAEGGGHMRIVPVIDILGGRVVRGVAGRREHYAPIETPLCRGSAPLEVLAALLDLYPFEAVYMADLDAIEHGRDNPALVEQVLERFPAVELWLDAGRHSATGLARWQAHPRLHPVLGSESQTSAGECHALLAADEDRALLSLDFRAGEFLGPGQLERDAAHWPRRLIVMTLDNVGSAGGPAIERLREVLARAGDREVHAAGGLRGPTDAQALATLGCAGALVASALHSGALGRDDLQALASMRI